MDGTKGSKGMCQSPSECIEVRRHTDIQKLDGEVRLRWKVKGKVGDC